MELTEFKKLRRHYGAIAALRIYICQNAAIDVFTADSHLCELVEEHGMGKVERFTSKRLLEFAEATVDTIREQMTHGVSLRQKHFIHKVFSKN